MERLTATESLRYNYLKDMEYVTRLDLMKEFNIGEVAAISTLSVLDKKGYIHKLGVVQQINKKRITAYSINKNAKIKKEFFDLKKDKPIMYDYVFNNAFKGATR